jgi:hypothetical protein
MTSEDIREPERLAPEAASEIALPATHKAVRPRNGTRLVRSKYSKRLLPAGMLNVSGAACYLGVSRMKIWRWQKQGRLVFKENLISRRRLH